MNNAVATPGDVKLMNMTSMALFATFAVLGVFAMAQWVVRLPVFDIKSITVSGGVTHNNALTLRANVAPRMQGTFFTVDLDRVRAAFEAVPWVRHAVVRRIFPDHLHVDLQEHQAAAYWGSGSDLRLVNIQGEVFDANVGEVEQDMLPQLDGPEGFAAEVLSMYHAVAPLFNAVELPITRLELTHGGGWRAQLDTGATIELGRGTEDEVLARVRRFLGTLTQVVSHYERHISALETADLRHENGYAIRLRGVSTLVAEGLKK